MIAWPSAQPAGGPSAGLIGVAPSLGDEAASDGDGPAPSNAEPPSPDEVPGPDGLTRLPPHPPSAATSAIHFMCGHDCTCGAVDDD
jgi:hypothetical protein